MAKQLAERSEVVAQLGEVFRTYGYEGASLARITEGTGMGKGSMYHFFPGGKEEMAEAVLASIDGWFREQVFQPLRQCQDAQLGVARMFEAVGNYFRSGQRVCLVGVFALGQERDRFAERVQGYFVEWVEALTAALLRAGVEEATARAQAEDVVSGIQGGLVLARACGQPELFMRTLARLQQRLQ